MNKTTAPIVRLVIISGRSGVGKSSTAFEVCHKLRQRKYPHVHIDADNLDAADPRPWNNKLMLANLRAIWTNYAALKGEHMLILSGTAMVMEHADVKQVVREVSGSDVAMVPIILTASDELVEARLKQREIGTDLESHLVSTEKMGKELDEFNEIPVVRIRTDGRSVEDIAEEIVGIIETMKERAEVPL